MSSRVSIRRASAQEQRAKRQALWFMFFSLLFGVLFLFVVMPLIFRVVLGRIERTPITNDSGDVLPPQQPVLSPLDAYQKTPAIEIKGFTESGATVQLYTDGLQSSTTTAGEDGSFVFSLELVEGEHEFTAEAVDEAGNISATAPVQKVTVDVTAPTLTVEHPSNGTVFSLPRERSLTVRGQLSEAGTVYVNSAMIQSGVEGTFTLPVQLGEGDTTLTIRGQDMAGNETEPIVLTVSYRP